MPTDHGLRPDDLQSVQHARCQPIQPGKYETVDAAEGQSLRRFTSQHVKLMTKRQDLYLQRRSRPEQSDQRQPNQAANISHQPRASPDSTSLASRIEFPTMKGNYKQAPVGVANDINDKPADGILTFEQAVRTAREAVARARTEAASQAAGPPPTVRSAVESYVKERDARERRR